MSEEEEDLGRCNKTQGSYNEDIPSYCRQAGRIPAKTARPAGTVPESLARPFRICDRLPSVSLSITKARRAQGSVVIVHIHA